MTSENKNIIAPTQELAFDAFSELRVAPLLPPQEVLLAVREGEVPILNFKNSHQTCSMDCVYCDEIEDGGGFTPLIPDSDLEKTFEIIDRLQKKHGLKAVEFYGEGEPLSDWRLISHLIDKGLRLSLFSNGIFMTDERAEQLTEYGAIVKLKLDALDPRIFGEILFARDPGATQEKKVKRAEQVIAAIEKMLVAREKLGGQIGKLVASIVVTNVNLPDGVEVEESPLGEVLRFCQENLVVPQVNFVEEAGGNRDGKCNIGEYRAGEVNQYLRELFGVDPKVLADEDCFAMFAPILTTTGMIGTGPFGMGCEFPLRESVGQLGEIQFLSEPADLQKALSKLDKFRKSRENKMAIVSELKRIQKGEGIYRLTGTDKILPGCGAGVEENWLLAYAATLLVNEDYFQQEILPRADNILVQKWSPEEVAELIRQIEI